MSVNTMANIKQKLAQLGSTKEKVGVKDITQFWEEVGSEDVPWLLPHLTDLTKENLKTRRVETAKVDQNNPIWLEAPLRRLRMLLTHSAEKEEQTGVQSALAVEAAVFARIASNLQNWDASQVKDGEQFVVTLQQVLKHSNGVTPSADYGGLSLLLHVMGESKVANMDLLLDSWVFAMFEFKELVAQLRPLLRFFEEVNGQEFKRFLKSALIFFQGQLPSVRAEGFNLYLLGEMEGGLLREMLDQFARYDPDQQLATYMARTLRPLAEAAASLIETRTDSTALDEIQSRMDMCRALLACHTTSEGVKAQLATFLAESASVVDELLALDVARMSAFLGFQGVASRVVQGVAPAPIPVGVIQPGAVLAPPAPPQPAQQGIPPPPPMPQGGVYAPAATASVIPEAPPLPAGGIQATLAAGPQPKLCPSRRFNAKKFFRAMCSFCRVLDRTLVERKRKVKRAAGLFQPWRVKNYLLAEITPISLWGCIKKEHLEQLEADIGDVVNDIQDIAGSCVTTKLLTVVYMVKDLDCTPCGADPAVIESNVARLRWLVDNIFLLYPHLHGEVCGGVLYGELTHLFNACGFDPCRRLELWETMLGFNNRFVERSLTTHEANQHLTELVNNPSVKQLLVAVLMHQRQIGEEDGEDGNAEDKIDSCKNATRHFALLRAMVDNLCKNYKGIVILDAVENSLPSLLTVESKLKSTQDCLTTDLDAILDELEGDERKRKLEAASPSSRQADTDCDVATEKMTTFIVEEREFAMNCAKVPACSMLYAMAHTTSFNVDDESGNIPLHDVCAEQFAHITDFYNKGTLPTGLSNVQWNDFKVTCNFLSLEDIMHSLVEEDHIFYDKLTHFFHTAQRNINSVTPVSKDAEDTLEVLSGLFKRITRIYEHIDTRSLTNIFSAL